jgi:hypothetical protein
LEELQKDPWGVPADLRATRCTGTALSIAASLLGACVPGSGARILAFIGGPSTEGPGAVSTAGFTFSMNSLMIIQFHFHFSMLVYAQFFEFIQKKKKKKKKLQ